MEEINIMVFSKPMISKAHRSPIKKDGAVKKIPKCKDNIPKYTDVKKTFTKEYHSQESMLSNSEKLFQFDPNNPSLKSFGSFKNNTCSEISGQKISDILSICNNCMVNNVSSVKSDYYNNNNNILQIGHQSNLYNNYEKGSFLDSLLFAETSNTEQKVQNYGFVNKETENIETDDEFKDSEDTDLPSIDNNFERRKLSDDSSKIQNPLVNYPIGNFNISLNSTDNRIVKIASPKIIIISENNADLDKQENLVNTEEQDDSVDAAGQDDSVNVAEQNDSIHEKEEEFLEKSKSSYVNQREYFLEQSKNCKASLNDQYSKHSLIDYDFMDQKEIWHENANIKNKKLSNVNNFTLKDKYELYDDFKSLSKQRAKEELKINSDENTTDIQNISFKHYSQKYIHPKYDGDGNDSMENEINSLPLIKNTSEDYLSTGSSESKIVSVYTNTVSSDMSLSKINHLDDLNTKSGEPTIQISEIKSTSKKTIRKFRDEWRHAWREQSKNKYESNSRTAKNVLQPRNTYIRNENNTITVKFTRRFNAFATYGSALKTGLVITKDRSMLWLLKAGFFEGYVNANTAYKTFQDLAGAKIVMSIKEYVNYLKYLFKGRFLSGKIMERLSNTETPQEI